MGANKLRCVDSVFILSWHKLLVVKGPQSVCPCEHLSSYFQDQHRLSNSFEAICLPDTRLAVTLPPDGRC